VGTYDYCQVVKFAGYQSWAPQKFLTKFDIQGKKALEIFKEGTSLPYWKNGEFNDLPNGATLRFKEGDEVVLDYTAVNDNDATVRGGYRRNVSPLLYRYVETMKVESLENGVPKD